MSANGRADLVCCVVAKSLLRVPVKLGQEHVADETGHGFRQTHSWTGIRAL